LLFIAYFVATIIIISIVLDGQKMRATAASAADDL